MHGHCIASIILCTIMKPYVKMGIIIALRYMSTISTYMSKEKLLFNEISTYAGKRSFMEIDPERRFDTRRKFTKLLSGTW